MTIVTPPPAIDRDRWGRPLVVPPTGGKKVAYTRCTTYIDVLEDKFNLQKWMQRMVAVGLAQRPDLQLSVAAHADDKRELDRICDQAREAATANAAATTGTALHALTELIDRGLDLPVLPDAAKADLDAYVAATKHLKATHIEQFCVQDPLKVGGTPDRVVEFGGQRFIADIKTGSIEWGSLKIAMQLALYARSRTYDIGQQKRGDHGADHRRGIIIHLPAGQARCDLHWVDLESGWEAVKVAREVRHWRTLKFGDLTEPVGDTVPEHSIRRGRTAEENDAALEDHKQQKLERMIRACSDAEAVRQLWADYEQVWNDDLTAVASKHIQSLPEAS